MLNECKSRNTVLSSDTVIVLLVSVIQLIIPLYYVCVLRLDVASSSSSLKVNIVYYNNIVLCAAVCKFYWQCFSCTSALLGTP